MIDFLLKNSVSFNSSGSFGRMYPNTTFGPSDRDRLGPKCTLISSLHHLLGID